MSVVRGKDGEKRRPMLSTFVGNNRQMLTEIRDSLSHLRKTPGDGSRPDHVQGFGENQLAPPPAGGVGGKGRHYTQMALAEIKQSLEGFQVNEPNSSGLAFPNGYDLEVQPVSEHLLRQLMQMGYDEVCIMHWWNQFACCMHVHKTWWTYCLMLKPWSVNHSNISINVGEWLESWESQYIAFGHNCLWIV